MIRSLWLWAALASSVLLSTTGTVSAAGDGLDRNAYRQGNSTFAGQHIGARAARHRARRAGRAAR